ncbi:MAG: NifU family protein [Chlamydiota bacterium]
MIPFLSFQHVGFFASEKQNAILIRGWEKDISKGWALCLYVLCSESKKEIVDVKFQVFGPILLIGCADLLCAWMKGKSISQLYTISPSFLSDHLSTESLEVDEKVVDFLFLIIRRILIQCLPEREEEKSFSPSSEEWKGASLERKKEMVEEILDKEVRPYISMDQGGVQVVYMEKDEVTIIYEGACVGCSGAGNTLLSIERVLQQYIHPDIRVKVQETSF